MSALSRKPHRTLRQGTPAFFAVTTSTSLSPTYTQVSAPMAWQASLKDAKAPMSYQFMRLGYFCPDSKDSSPDHLVFNRSVSLKDSFKPGK